MADVLIIGYGDTLRTDDSIGVEAAKVLAEFYRNDPAVRVITSHQLTPEMAEDLAASRFVLFLDAAVGERPGVIAKTQLRANDQAGSFSHRCSPVALLKAAAQLYGNAPSALSLTMSATSFELGMALSPEISRRMPDFLTAAKHVVADFTNRRRARPIRLASQSGG